MTTDLPRDVPEGGDSAEHPVDRPDKELRPGPWKWLLAIVTIAGLVLAPLVFMVSRLEQMSEIPLDPTVVPDQAKYDEAINKVPVPAGFTGRRVERRCEDLDTECRDPAVSYQVTSTGSVKAQCDAVGRWAVQIGASVFYTPLLTARDPQSDWGTRPRPVDAVDVVDADQVAQACRAEVAADPEEFFFGVGRYVKTVTPRTVLTGNLVGSTKTGAAGEGALFTVTLGSPRPYLR